MFRGREGYHMSILTLSKNNACVMKSHGHGTLYASLYNTPLTEPPALNRYSLNAVNIILWMFNRKTRQGRL